MQQAIRAGDQSIIQQHLGLVIRTIYSRRTSLTILLKVKVKVMETSMGISHACVYRHAQFECHSLNIVIICRATLKLHQAGRALQTLFKVKVNVKVIKMSMII